MTGIVGNNGSMSSLVRSFRSRGFGLTSHLSGLALALALVPFSLVGATGSVESLLLHLLGSNR